MTVTRFSMLGLWLLAVSVLLVQLGRILHKQWGLGAGARSCRARCQEVLNVLAHQSVTWTAIRFIILVVPPLFYVKIVLPCWECYDFEAAATHEVRPRDVSRAYSRSPHADNVALTPIT